MWLLWLWLLIVRFSRLRVQRRTSVNLKSARCDFFDHPFLRNEQKNLKNNKYENKHPKKTFFHAFSSASGLLVPASPSMIPFSNVWELGSMAWS